MGDVGLTALLFSGGMDSVALAYWQRPDLLLTINYGQVVAESEIKAAHYFADELGLPLTILSTDFRCTGTGSLANTDHSIEGSHPEWWPFRNQLLISVAAAWGVTRNVSRLLIGSVKSDSCFGDGTIAFIDAMSSVLAVQEGAIKLEAPAISMGTLELIHASGIPTRYLPMCFSCNVSLRPCGACRSCTKFIETMHALEK